MATARLSMSFPLWHSMMIPSAKDGGTFLAKCHRRTRRLLYPSPLPPPWSWLTVALTVAQRQRNRPRWRQRQRNGRVVALR
jgi:hypothetical protein